MDVLMTSRFWPKVDTSAMFKAAPRAMLEKLIGFFSMWLAEVVDIVVDGLVRKEWW